jgi:hypothetical protein
MNKNKEEVEKRMEWRREGKGRAGRCGALDIDLIGSLTIAVLTSSLSASHYLQ